MYLLNVASELNLLEMWSNYAKYMGTDACLVLYSNNLEFYEGRKYTLRRGWHIIISLVLKLLQN